MKGKIFLLALVAISSITGQLFAQETSALKTRTKSNQTNEQSSGNITGIDDWKQSNAKVAQGQHIKKATLLVCRVTPTDDGCSVTFGQEVKSPRDAASGLATGKRGYDYYKSISEFNVSSIDNSITEVVSPRDAASGLPTGRRMHKPMVITKELDKASPKLIEKVVQGRSSSNASPADIAIDEPGVQKNSSAGSGMGAGKATFKEFTITKRCSGKTTKIDCTDGECDIPLDDCPNGDCSVIASWSWGATNSGSSTMGSGMGSGKSVGSASFLLTIEDGGCTAMAINEKGLPGDKKPVKSNK